MGTLKPLLPLGPSTAIERVISSLHAAGVTQAVVVTGHGDEAVAPVLERLGIARAHNAGYESGMFSSVRTGVAALPENIDAFFVLPVDCPLVTPRVLRLLAQRFLHGSQGIVYPTCFGHRGHPPLISAGLVRPLLDADPASNLQAFLSHHAADEAHIDVRDLTVLLDMDTPDDYEALRTFAVALDGAARGRASSAAPGAAGAPGAAPGPEPSLTAREALFLLAAAGTPANIVRHCRTAATVGETLALALKSRRPALDADLVRSGCLLHDIARVLPHHARLAQEVLANLGLPRLGAVVGEHMVISPDLPSAPGVTEAELVYLADKLVADGEVVGLEERQARTVRKMRPDPKTAERIAERIDDARTIAAKVAAILDHPIEEVLAGIAIPAGARPSGLQVFLVRHAEPAGPSGKRYQGQADPPLGPKGEEQARALAGRLMAMTGGACFDAVFSSDLQRTARTAEIAVDDCKTPVTPLPWLREIDVGLWEGLTREEARERFPVESHERERDLTGVPFPRGESFKDLRARVVPGFERLVEESIAAGRRRVLVVAHRGVNRVLLAHFRGLPLEGIFSIEQDYCTVTVLRLPKK